MYRQFTKDLPDEVTVFCGLVHAPDGSGMKLCALALCHCGELGQAEADLSAAAGLRAARRWISCSRCLTRSSTRCSTTASRRGALNYWKSAFFTELTDAAVQTMIAAFEAAPSIMSGMMVEHFHGAVCRVDPTATAYPHREPGYNLVLIGQWLDPAETDANVAWVRETFAALGAVHGAEVVRELPRRRRERAGSPTPTGRTWGGSPSSSVATTPTTCSASTTTSIPPADEPFARHAQAAGGLQR